MDVYTKEPEQAVHPETAPADVEPEAEGVPAENVEVEEEESSSVHDDAAGEGSGIEESPEISDGEAAAGVPPAGSGGEQPRESGEGTAVRRAEFQPLSTGGPAVGADNLRILMDVVVPVTVELGAATLPLRRILDLGPGSVVRLDRSLGEPADILVNGERVGRGEVVVVDDQFGVRVTELMNPDIGCSTQGDPES